MKKEISQLKKEEPDVFEDSRCGRYQEFLWNLLEKPDTSLAAKVLLKNLPSFDSSLTFLSYVDR